MEFSIFGHIFLIFIEFYDVLNRTNEVVYFIEETTLLLPWWGWDPSTSPLNNTCWCTCYNPLASSVHWKLYKLYKYSCVFLSFPAATRPTGRLAPIPPTHGAVCSHVSTKWRHPEKRLWLFCEALVHILVQGDQDCPPVPTYRWNFNTVSWYIKINPNR